MKKIFFLFFMLLFATAFAQQTPKTIYAALANMKSMIEKYDNGYDSAYYHLNKQIEANAADHLSVSVWHSCMAQLLNAYYEENRYRILDRTAVVDELNPDFNMWDEKTFLSQIVYHHQKALTFKTELQAQPMDKYALLLDTLTALAYRPSLYDFLAHRALDFYIDNHDFAAIFDFFDMNDSAFFSDNNSFLSLSFFSQDTLSFRFLSLQLFRQLTQFHLEQNNYNALIDISLKRLLYVYNQSETENKNVLYLQSLLALEKEMRNKKGYEDICFGLGDFFEHINLTTDTVDTTFKDNKVIAVKWYEKAIAADSLSMTAKNAENSIKSIKKASIQVEILDNLMPDCENLITVTLKNCDTLFFRIIPQPKADITKVARDPKLLYKMLIKERYVRETSILLRYDKNYTDKTADLLLPPLSAGKYVLILSPVSFNANNEGYSSAFFTVSSISAFSRNNNGNFEVFVTDCKSGDPLKDATVEVTLSKPWGNGKPYEHKTVKTDSQGCCRFLVSQVDTKVDISVSWHDDPVAVLPTSFLWHNGTPPAHSVSSYFFTDRNIYRPGQKVFFKCVVMEQNIVNNNCINKPVANKPIDISLTDNNGQTIKVLSLTTNEYGSVSGSFDLPENVLTGKFRLSAMKNSCYFSVEAYKRPTFEVTIHKPVQQYRAGQIIDMTGSVKAYSGYAVENAQVAYHVVRTTSFPWWRYWQRCCPNTEKCEIASGHTQTDANGLFCFNFTAKEQPGADSYSPLYNYTVSVEVVDVTGETHSSQITIPVSNQLLLLSVDIPDNVAIDAEKHCFPILLTNLSGAPQKAIMTYEITALATPPSFLHSRRSEKNASVNIMALQQIKNRLPYIDFDDTANPYRWQETAKIARGELLVDSSACFSIPDLSSMKEGYYKIIMTIKDDAGQNIVKEKVILLYNDNSKKCAAYKPLWITASKESAAVGDKISFHIGTYLNNAEVFYEIISNDTLLRSKQLTLNKNTVSFDYTVTESDKGKITVHAFVIQNNYFYQEKVTVCVPYNDNKLNFEWITFRNNILPGSHQEWKLKIKDENGLSPAAELLCTMYDASLDVLGGKHLFDFNVNKRIISSFAFQLSENNNYDHSYYQPFQSSNFSIESRRYPNLRWRLSERKYNSFLARNFSCEHISSSDAYTEAAPDILTDDVIFDVEDVEKTDNVAEEESVQSGSLRTNFNENAFFYPHLQTDKMGNVLFSFTVPDALTRWNFLAVAHTKEMVTGVWKQEIITKKSLMIIPNTPRIVREGDTLLFAAKVVNVGNEPVSGKVQLSFFNAADSSSLDIIDGLDYQLFTVMNDSTVSVKFPITVPYDVAALVYRIIATGKNETSGMSYTDGEENMLPVLTNKSLVTETMPVYINGKGKKKFVFESYLKKATASEHATRENYRLTFEFSSAPMWYAVQALPYLTDYSNSSNEQIFNSYYADMLASYVANASPKIREVFHQWENEASSELCSNLEKNEELKSIALQETPWLLDALNESANKQKIGILFDDERMNREKTNVLSKLEKFQNRDGGWSWFAAGKSNRYITQYIVSGFGHLEVMGIDKTPGFLKKALQFIDNDMFEDYSKLKEHTVAPLSATEIQYLYARSFFIHKFPVNQQYKEVYTFYLNNAKKTWEKENVYMQALIALSLFRSGEKETAVMMMKNIRQRAQYSDELGMFWKKEGMGYWWYEAPIERQSLLMEAFHLILNDTASVEKMQLWLLKQKQVQSWSTSRATADACYALLVTSSGMEQLTASDNTEVTVGNWSSRQQEGAEIGTGYIKKVWGAEAMNDEKANVVIEKQASGAAWGALYWQYFENMDQVSQYSGSGLSLKNKLYRVVLSSQGETLKAINEDDVIRVGEKLRLRLELRADRDMEYVHLHAVRAAAFEPVNVISQYKFQDGLYYYESTEDACTNFFIDYLKKGSYVFEYTVIATQEGTFDNGFSSVQCMYAPEFEAHGNGCKVKIVKE